MWTLLTSSSFPDSWIVLYLPVVIGRVGDVLLRENLWCHCAAPYSWSPGRTRSRIEVFLENDICHDGGQPQHQWAMVSFRPFSLQLCYSLSFQHRDIYSIAASIQLFLQVRLIQGVARWNPKFVQFGSLRRFSFSMELQSTGATALIATMFSQASRRDSPDLCCFSLVVAPSRW